MPTHMAIKSQNLPLLDMVRDEYVFLGKLELTSTKGRLVLLLHREGPRMPRVSVTSMGVQFPTHTIRRTDSRRPLMVI